MSVHKVIIYANDYILRVKENTTMNETTSTNRWGSRIRLCLITLLGLSIFFKIGNLILPPVIDINFEDIVTVIIYWIMLLFTAFSVSALVSFSIFLWRENEKDIQTVEKFIDYELWEFEEKEELKGLPDEQLFKNALEEIPKIPDVYVEFFYHGKKYTKPPYLPDRKHNFLDYYSVTKTYQPKGYEPIEVKITKRFAKNRLLIFYNFGSLIFFLLVCLFIISRIQKRFTFNERRIIRK